MPLADAGWLMRRQLWMPGRHFRLVTTADRFAAAGSSSPQPVEA